jgi:hypothetical protein
MDTGTGYERKKSTYIADLTEVGRDTPMNGAFAEKDA